MGKISTYSIDALPTLSDKVIGTDLDDNKITKNYLLSDIIGLVPQPTLQTVLDAGNSATQNIILKGNIYTETLEVGITSLFYGNATFNNDVLFDYGNVEFQGGVKDGTASLGTSGQFLSATTSGGVLWATPPSTPGNLQEVLDTGNSAVQNINLDGDVYANVGEFITLGVSGGARFNGTAEFNNAVNVNSELNDGTGASGTAGQVLSSTGSGVEWVDNVVIVQPNLNVVLEASSFDIQEPVGTNSPLQVTFGPAQVHQDIELSSDGTITFMTDGTYFIKGFGSVERNGNSGGVASLLYRVLINGVPAGNTYGVDLNSVGIMIPLSISQPINASATDRLTFEIMRDDNGVNQGGLYTHVVSGGIWQTVPSASITIWKLN